MEPWLWYQAALGQFSQASVSAALTQVSWTPVHFLDVYMDKICQLTKSLGREKALDISRPEPGETGEQGDCPAQGNPELQHP